MSAFSYHEIIEILIFDTFDHQVYDVGVTLLGMSSADVVLSTTDHDCLQWLLHNAAKHDTSHGDIAGQRTNYMTS